MSSFGFHRRNSFRTCMRDSILISGWWTFKWGRGSQNQLSCWGTWFITEFTNGFIYRQWHPQYVRHCVSMFSSVSPDYLRQYISGYYRDSASPINRGGLYVLSSSSSTKSRERVHVNQLFEGHMYPALVFIKQHCLRSLASIWLWSLAESLKCLLCSFTIGMCLSADQSFKAFHVKWTCGNTSKW